jgi:hypothetical protein
MKKYELGCYGTGSLGHQHTRERCADIVEEVMAKMGNETGYPDSRLRGIVEDLTP